MDVRLVRRAASERDQAGDPHISGPNIGSEQVDGFSTKASRLPPVTLLAPLQFLQSHRRGSITDPKLHAAPKPPLLCLPGPIPGDLHYNPLVPTFPHDLSGGSTRMATSAIATSVADTKTRNKRSLRPAEDAGEHIERVISTPEGARRLISRLNCTAFTPAINTDNPHKPPRPIAGKKRKQPGSELPQHIDPKLVMDEEERKPKRRMSGLPAREGPEGPEGDRPGGDTWPTHGMPDLESGTQPMDTNETVEAAPAHPTFDPSQPATMQMVPPVAFTQNGGVQSTEPQQLPSSAGPTRSLRSRSRPPSRGVGQQLRGGTDQTTLNDQAGQTSSNPDDESSPQSKENGRPTPYSRSPELRVSHKLAERKRRKEMKDLFDELRDQLPQDRGMKASKWEILSKGTRTYQRSARRFPGFADAHLLLTAIDFIAHMKQSHADMSREIEMLRHEVESFRQGIPFHPGGPPHPVLYGQHVVPPFPGMHQGPPPPHPGAQPTPGHPPVSEGETAQPSFPTGDGPSTNGVVTSRTGTPSS